MFVPLHDSTPLKVIRFQTVTLTIIALNIAMYLSTGAFNTEAVLANIAFGANPSLFRKLPFDPKDTYSVAKDWGTTGYMYRSDLVKERPTTWREFVDLAKTTATEARIVDATIPHAGTLRAESRPNTAGNSPSRAAASGISAQIIVQPLRAPNPEMITTIAMTLPAQVPPNITLAAPPASARATSRG